MPRIAPSDPGAERTGYTTPRPRSVRTVTAAAAIQNRNSRTGRQGWGRLRRNIGSRSPGYSIRAILPLDRRRPAPVGAAGGADLETAAPSGFDADLRPGSDATRLRVPFSGEDDHSRAPVVRTDGAVSPSVTAAVSALNRTEDTGSAGVTDRDRGLAADAGCGKCIVDELRGPEEVRGKASPRAGSSTLLVHRTKVHHLPPLCSVHEHLSAPVHTELSDADGSSHSESGPPFR